MHMIRLLCLFAFVATAYKTASKFEKLKINLELSQGSCSSPTPLQSTSTSISVTQTVTVGTSSTTLCRSGTSNPVQIYYKYSPPTGTTQALSINTFGSSYDTLLAAWSCTTCGGTSLSCNDDTPNNRQSAITVNVTDCIYIGVAGYSKAVGKLVLNVTVTSSSSTNTIKPTVAAPTTCPSDYHTIVEGDACAVTTRCDYEPFCCCPNSPNPADRQCSPTMSYTCTGGKWGPAAAALINCNGAQCPGSSCPDAAPTSGSCNSGLSCNYGGKACCPDYDWINYQKKAQCSNANWNVTTPAGACPPCPGTDGGGCPDVTPGNGVSCPTPNLTCKYDLTCCCGTCFFTTFATCHDSAWGVAQVFAGCPCRSGATPPPAFTPPTAESLLARRN